MISGTGKSENLEKLQQSGKHGLDGGGPKDPHSLLKAGKKAPFPKSFPPMLATLVDTPFNDPDWIYEIKWDGYRAIALIGNGNVELVSRNGKSFNEKFYPVYDALGKWDINAVLDGEIVVLNEHGLADFSALQGWRSEADGDLAFYVFDILYFEGKDLTQIPLRDRRELLKLVLPKHEDIFLSQVFEASGFDFFKAADKMGLEGIIAKRADSTYAAGKRSRDWLKIKTEKRQEALICGYTNNEGSPKKFSALLMGVYDGKKLNYIGPVGTGFTDKLQGEILDKLKPWETNTCPFKVVPDFNKPSRFRPNPPKATVTWVEPKIIAEVSYRELTDEGVMRHPSFKGLRDDKSPREVVQETEAPTASMVAADTLIRERTKKTSVKPRKTLLNPKDETQVRSINGQPIKFTNLSKIFWPDVSATKRDMLNYYYQAAPFILPYIKDRPQSLNRFPNGINGKSFYQKNMAGKVPDWVELYAYESQRDDHDKAFMVGTNEASLLLMASMGSVEMNPWFSRVQSPDNPDYCIIDLDPDQNSFEQVISAAQEFKKVLDSIGVISYCKTSGSTGLHIYIPLGAKYSYDQSQMFARLLVTIVHKIIPEYTSIERMIANRKGKMYLDFLQNRPHATIASAYSLRPKPGATVSMPLYWEEVKPGLQMKDFHIFNAIARMQSEGDIFAGTLGKGIDLEKALQQAKLKYNI